jgi:general secretion pathway protein G
MTLLVIGSSAVFYGQNAVDADVREDKNLHPLNSDLDLYSIGPDGKTNLPLTAKASHDDIIRANDGGYFGVASNY